MKDVGDVKQLGDLKNEREIGGGWMDDERWREWKLDRWEG